MTQYIDWDAEFKAACDIVETVPGLEDTIYTGEGDLYEAGAPCGCWIAYSCSHPSAVGLCDKHKAEMPDVYAPIPDPYEGLSESDTIFVMDLVEILGYDINDARAIACGS